MSAFSGARRSCAMVLKASPFKRAMRARRRACRAFASATPASTASARADRRPFGAAEGGRAVNGRRGARGGAAGARGESLLLVEGVHGPGHAEGGGVGRVEARGQGGLHPALAVKQQKSVGAPGVN